MRILKNSSVSKNETVAVLVEREAPIMVSSHHKDDRFNFASLPVREERTHKSSVFRGKHVVLLPVHERSGVEMVLCDWGSMEEVERLEVDTDGEQNKHDHLDMEGIRIVKNFHRLMYLFAACYEFGLELVYTDYQQAGFKLVKTPVHSFNAGSVVIPRHNVMLSIASRGETTNEFRLAEVLHYPDPLGTTPMNAPFLGSLDNIESLAMCLPLYTLLDDIVIQKLERKVCVSIGAPLYTFAPEIAPYHEIKNAIAGIGKYVNELIK